MEKVFFKTSDNFKLCGIWHLPKTKNNKVIILAHGLAADKDEYGIFVDLAEKLKENGFAVFRFDFRCRGESEGGKDDLLVANELKDLDAAIKQVVKKGYKIIGLVGASFAGGSVTFYTANNQNIIKALCLWNPCLNYDHCLLSPVTSHNKPYLAKWKIDFKEKGYTTMGRIKLVISYALFEEIKNLFPYKALKEILVPTLILHGNNDDYVPYEDSVNYVKYLKNGKLVTIVNGEHGFQENPNDRKTAIFETLKFFKKNL